MNQGQPSEPGGQRRSTVVLTSRAPADAARALASMLDRWVPGRGIVVTPGPLAARALGVGHRSLADLARTVLAERGHRVAGALTRRAALQSAVADAWAPDDAAGTARSVEPTVRELLKAGAGVGGVDVRQARDGFPRLARLLELVEAYRRLLAVDGLVDGAEALWLAAGHGGKGDADGAGEALLVCGYPLLGPDQLAFLSAYAADGSVVLLPQAPTRRRPTVAGADAYLPNEEAAAALAGRGWQVVRDAAADDAPSAAAADSGSQSGATGDLRLSGYRLASLDAEVRFVLTAVKALLLDGAAPADIVLVAPDPRLYGPVMADVAREYGVPLLPSYSVPLASTPVGYLVGTIAGVVAGGLPFEETARLLSHRLVRPLSPEAWTRARLEHPTTVSRWQRIDPRAAQLDWPRRATRAEYARRLEDTLAGLGTLELLEGEAQGRAHLDLVVASLTAYVTARDEAAGARPDLTVNLSTFVSELLDHLQLVTVSKSGPLGGGRAVAVVAPSLVAGAVVRHLFLLGAVEGAVPARLDPGPRLDFVERKAAREAGLAVSAAAQAARHEALAFDALVRAARDSLMLTFPESGERDAQLPSPYFAALGLVPVAPEASALWEGASQAGAPEAVAPKASGDGFGGPKPAASPEELRRTLLATGDTSSLADDPVLAGARHALAVEARRESAAAPDQYDGVIGEPYPAAATTFSATSLLALGQCTFKWFAQYALGLREPEEVDDELSPLVRGNLYHTALELAFRAAGAAGDPTRAGVEAALPEAFARAERDEAAHTANWLLHRDQHLAALRRVVRSETFLPDGTEVVGTELRFGAQHGSPAHWRGFAVSGRIDRVDRRAGGLTLVDYKTSSSRPLGVQDAAGDAKVDLQLPMYLEAAVPALDLGAVGPASAAPRSATGTEPVAFAASAAGSSAAAAEYYSLTKARVIASTSLAGDDAYDPAALQAFAVRAHAALDQGRYPVDPDRARKACDYCAFDAVCRVGPRVERKRSADG